MANIYKGFKSIYVNVPQLIADYQSGMLIDDIERKHRIDRSTLYIHLKRNNIPQRYKGFTVQHNLTSEQASIEYNQNKLTMLEIAKKYNVSQSTVSRLLRGHRNPNYYNRSQERRQRAQACKNKRYFNECYKLALSACTTRQQRQRVMQQFAKFNQTMRSLDYNILENDIDMGDIEYYNRETGKKLSRIRLQNSTRQALRRYEENAIHSSQFIK